MGDLKVSQIHIEGRRRKFHKLTLQSRTCFKMRLFNKDNCYQLGVRLFPMITPKTLTKPSCSTMLIVEMRARDPN